MSESRNLTTEMWTLADALLDERISADGVRQLEAMLDENPSAQAEFIEYCQLHVNLHANVRAQRVIDDFCKQQKYVASTVTPPVNDARKPMPFSFLLRGLPKGRGPMRLALVASVILICVSAYEIGRWNSRRGFASSLERAQNGVETTFRAATSEIGTLKLTSGTATLEIPKVGHVLLEGPAHFELLSPMRARLTQGRMKMRVTEATGHGFVVETRDGEVTDLGTEFALNVNSNNTGLVVFDGVVDLRLKPSVKNSTDRIERLVQGEGVTFSHFGDLDRIGSIVTGAAATFLQGGDLTADGTPPLIADVSDNRGSDAAKKYYEIVPAGLKEDSQAYVDRPHEWNGIYSTGMPSYLLNADYVRTFADERWRRKIEVKVTIGRPATLFLFFDTRIAVPEWLKENFQPTGDRIGMDVGRWGSKKKRVVGIGPGNSINAEFNVWKRVVTEPGVVTLGSPSTLVRDLGGMYGIAAVALAPSEEKVSSSR
jgi:hypothetical protein